MHPECSEILNTYIIQRKPEKYNGFFEFSFRTAGYFPARVVLFGGDRLQSRRSPPTFPEAFELADKLE